MDAKRLEREAEKERLKAEFRADLEARKKFKERVDAAVNESRIGDALYKVNQRLEELARLSETTDEMTARLRSQSAVVEAKLDIALEGRAVGSENGAVAPPPETPSASRSAEKTLGDRAEVQPPPREITQTPKKTFFDQEE